MMCHSEGHSVEDKAARNTLALASATSRVLSNQTFLTSVRLRSFGLVISMRSKSFCRQASGTDFFKILYRSFRSASRRRLAFGSLLIPLARRNSASAKARARYGYEHEGRARGRFPPTRAPPPDPFASSFPSAFPFAAPPAPSSAVPVLALDPKLAPERSPVPRTIHAALRYTSDVCRSAQRRRSTSFTLHKRRPSFSRSVTRT